VSLESIQEIVFQHLASERDQREARESMLPEGVLHSSASSAGQCARAIGLRVANLAPTDPPEADSLFNFFVGDQIHDIVQRAIVNKWPNSTTETGGVIEDFMVGHSDVLYEAEDSEKVVCEIKSTADFGFELATGVALKSNGRWKSKTPKPAEGPKREHKLQAGIYAIMHGAKYVAIVYVRKTAAKDEPVIYEWRFKSEELKDAAEMEILRHKGIVEMVRGGRIPDREYNGEIIANPNSVRFPCSYCNYRQACLSLGAGEVEIAT
jgi:hypothetical protein